MSLKKYRAFVETVDLGSLTKAAEKLNYTQPGISHMILSLENEFGFPLLIRGKNGVTPTPEAEKLMVFLRQIVNGEEKLKEEGHAFSVNDFVLKAVAKALRRHPEILVSLDGEQIIRRAHVNLGMAVALDAGLIVPVIRDADLLSLEALSAKAKDLAERARANQLGADEYKGSTFTVSNLGMFGVESFTPIINQPDAAILGVNCTEDELVMEDDGTIAKHQVLRISLTFDHRLLDGAVAAKFEMTVRDLLEHPMDILL